MKKSIKRVITLVIVFTLILGVMGCSDKNADTTKKENNESISGDVSLAVPGAESETITKLISKFNEEYPNINVTIRSFEGGANEYLTAQAASKNLPDIVYGWDSIPYAISQGWINPLNEFLDKDDEFKNVPESLVADFIYKDKVFALPTRITTDGVVINLDLMEQLNLDPPEYDWTIDNFTEYAKKATTDKYSGIHNMNLFEDIMLPMFGKDLSSWGYNPILGKFELKDSGAFEKLFQLRDELTNVPGLVSGGLWNNKLRDEGKLDDYQKKFGKDADGFGIGKVLFRIEGSWILGDRIKFNYDYYPLPIDSKVGYKESIHIDHAFMTHTTKDKEAAFELLKWITYSTKGVLASFALRKEVEKPDPYLYIPPTHNKEISDIFNDSHYVNGIKYIYNNLDKAHRGDNFKVIPGMRQAMDEVLNNTLISSIAKGEKEASAVVSEVEEKANNIIKEAMDKLYSDMEQFDYYK